jgi:hypothetical protein
VEDLFAAIVMITPREYVTTAKWEKDRLICK